MARYGVTAQRTASAGTTLATIGTNSTGTIRRIKIYDLTLGSEATPGDNPFLYRLQRFTASGTGTAVTPQALDPADAAFAGVAKQAHTAEPTYTAAAILKSAALNQRSTYRWVAAPGGELVIPAVADNGIGTNTPTASAVVITGSFHAEEQ